MSVMFRRPQFPGIFLKRLAVLLILAGVSPADSLANELLELRTYRAQEPLVEEGMQHLERDDFAAARKAFEHVIEAQPKFPGKYGLYFLLAECAREMGDPARVVSYLGEVVHYPPLANIGYWELAEAHLARGQEEKALEALSSIKPGSPQYPEAAYQRAVIYLRRGQFGDAARDAEDAYMEALTENRRVDARILQADIHDARGNREDALRIIRALWWENSGDGEAVLERLKQWSAVPTQLEEFLREFGDLTRYNAKKRRGDLTKRLKKTRGRAFSGLRELGEGWLRMNIRGERETAPDWMRKALKKAKGNEILEPWARLGEALALRKLDREVEAVEVYLQLIEVYPSHILVPSALFGAGQLMMKNSLTLEGERALRTLIADYPKAPERPRALWHLAWSNYLGKDYTRAIGFLDQLMRSHPTGKAPSGGYWRERALYWRAKCLQRMGQIEQAVAGYETLMGAYPVGYYAVLGWNQLERLGIQRDELDGILEKKDSEQPSIPEIFRRRELETAAELIRLDRLGMAASDLRSRILEGNGQAEGVRLLLWVRAQEGKPRTMRASVRKYATMGAAPSRETLEYWQQSYPTSFEKIIAKEAEANQLSVHMINAFIRKESRFNPKARSYASALGLMQLLAPVGRAIAKDLLGYKRLAARDLYKPHINVQLGTRMIRELHSMYRDNLPLVAASYNAGPYAVKKWMHQFGHVETDAFMEMIPYRGTASYAKTIVSSMLIYSILYGEAGAEYPRIPAAMPKSLGPYMKK